MGFLDMLLGRTKQAAPNLDVLFAVPSATYTLQAALDYSPTGTGAVCFKAAEGAASARTQDEITALLGISDATHAIEHDEYGYTWITIQQPDTDLSALVTDLHATNTTLVDAGFGTSLLCTVIGFTAANQRRLGLVYLFKRGTFYPFAPTSNHTRDNTLELQARAALEKDLPIEADLTRWFPLWSAPVP